MHVSIDHLSIGCCAHPGLQTGWVFFFLYVPWREFNEKYVDKAIFIQEKQTKKILSSL